MRGKRKKQRRILSEKNLKRSDSFRVQVQLKARENKILWACIYNWIAEDYPEVAERIIKSEEIADAVIKRLKQEFRTILNSDNFARDKQNAFLNEILDDTDLDLQKEVDRIINRTLRR